MARRHRLLCLLPTRSQISRSSFLRHNSRREKIANIAKEVNVVVVEDKPEDKDVVQVGVIDEVGIPTTTTIIISAISKEEKALQEVVVEVE